MRHVIVVGFLLLSIGAFSQRGGSSGGGSGNIFGSSSYNPDDTTKVKFFTIFKGNPGRAALYSLVLPGAGQLYNKRWWKVPLVYGLEGFTIYNYINSRNTFNRFDRCYVSLVESNVPIQECVIDASDENVLNTVRDAYDIRNRARSQKETYFLIMLGAHLFQSLEAFIDRHLIDFDVDDDLSYYTPHSYETQITVMSLKIPLNRKRKTTAP